MAEVHFISLQPLHDRLMQALAASVVDIWDTSVHRRGDPGTLVARLTDRGCRVAVFGQIPEPLMGHCRMAGIKTLMVQHGQYPEHWTRRCPTKHLPDRAILAGEHWLDGFREMGVRADVVGHGLATDALDRAEREFTDNAPRLLYCLPHTREHPAYYREIVGVIERFKGQIKPHPRDPVDVPNRYPGDSVYRVLKGLDVLVCGPSNLIFEAALLGVPCIVPNFDKRSWVEAYPAAMAHDPGELERLLQATPHPHTAADVEPFWHDPDILSLNRVTEATIRAIDEEMPCS